MYWLLLLVSLFANISCQSKSQRSKNDPQAFPWGIQSQTNPSPMSLIDNCSAQVPYDSKRPVKITAFDVLALPTDSVARLTVRVQKRLFAGVNFDKNKESVQISADQFSQSGSTQHDGIADFNYPLAAVTANPSCFVATVATEKQVGRIFRFDSNDPIIITDIDQVLSQLKEWKVPLTKNEDTPALPGAIEALQALSQRYRIVYLTARDDALFNKTRAWLQLRQFPAGPVFIWNWRVSNFYGASRKKQGEYKRKFIEDLRRKYLRVVAGVGNLPHDAEAYRDAGIRPIIISTENKGFGSGVSVVRSWSEIPSLL